MSVDIPDEARSEAGAAIDRAMGTAYGYVLGTPERDILIDVLYPVIGRQIRVKVAEAIWQDEQRCQAVIQKDPTSLYLAGRMVGLQRARDIALGGQDG